jgi:hypothetical protein
VTMLRTFMDETGVREDAEMVAVGGYISAPKNWRAWTKNWERDPFVAQLMPVMPAQRWPGS